MLDVQEYGVEIHSLVKQFPLRVGTSQVVTALDGVDLRINPGELFVILGPSGCGKSTLLRCVAGLEEPQDGTIALGGRTVFSAYTGEAVAPQDRKVGMVFQTFALYPHMTVRENVSFGLRTRKVPRPEAERRVAEALRLVDMEAFAERTPRHLSGGQQQRVSLARAIAGEARILLFDEPLSNLDPVLRKTVRAELKQLIRRVGTTTIFVTHDQEEAMILGDRLAVMNRGRIQQIGTPDEIYRHPQTRFVAGFTGRPVTNLIEGVVEIHEGETILVPIESRAATLRLPRALQEFRGQRVTLHVRPEDVEIGGNAEPEGSTTLAVQHVLPEGGHTYAHFELGGPYEPLVARTGPGEISKDAVDTQVRVAITGGNVYSADSGYMIGEFGRR